ncbi:hypothetical protein PR202_gn00429 [Eleusine coracana subsp. coracana]|uniref:Reverse transcriptase domain-containing protein n=1 Tax=Eleusine coracana subsp. coracana TaxID=191504 RepID=A0AAV5G1Q4_ELECO|nr:hypothetical protein PR202_gn00429 [Eleusine coracana subsp. coracana]
MLVQQTTSFLHSQKQPRVLLKLDISKAFNLVSWSFLLEVLEKLGFGSIFRDILSGLFTTSSTQVLLNGTLGDFIHHRRGLRQADPLSSMLFILVMDTLNLMVAKASDMGLLQPLSSRPIQHRISLYADDVVLFLWPVANEMDLTVNLLQIFGEASGLKINIQKSSVAPIQCEAHDLEVIQEHLPCQIIEFPVKYLGLPLSLKKLSKSQLQPFIDRLADLLPGWKAELMTRMGHAIFVQFVLTATIIYQAMALDFPPWVIKAMEKIMRGFLWQGSKEAHGGHCLLTWDRVAIPKDLGGLGISNLQKLGWALWVRWLWLQKTEPSKPWVSLPMQMSEQMKAIFSMAVTTELGDGRNTLFWQDRWILGQRLEDVAPLIHSIVPKRIVGKQTVGEALTTMVWIQDIHGVAIVEIIEEFMALCNVVTEFTLQPGTPDSHHWKLASTGRYSAKATYEALFQGSVLFEPCDRIWKTWSPPKCKFFMWLVAHNRCWTADRLARRNLPHPENCVLCDQEGEPINHILTGCVFARQFWWLWLQRVELAALAPQPTDDHFHEWWSKAANSVSSMLWKMLNSIIILGAWSLWIHRNECVFRGISPSLPKILIMAGEEMVWWSMAGAKDMSLLPDQGGLEEV